MFDRKLTIDLSGVGNDIPTRLGKIRPTLTEGGEEAISPSYSTETTHSGLPHDHK